MKLKVFKADGSSFEEKEVAGIPEFDGNKGLQAVKEVIVAIRANNRQGNASTKTRADVRGSGRKMFRQKGTGNARKGDRQSPVLHGGGVVFGPKPRDYSKKINDKVKRLAFRRIFSDRAREGAIVLLEKASVSEAKTREVDGVLSKISGEGSVLVVDQDFEPTFSLASRNIKRASLETAARLNPLQLSGFKTIVITESAMANLVEKRLGDQ